MRQNLTHRHRVADAAMRHPWHQGLKGIKTSSFLEEKIANPAPESSQGLAFPKTTLDTQLT